MKRKGKIVTSLSIMLLMISSTFVITTAIESQQSIDDHGEIDFTKSIWDPIEEIWAKSIDAEEGETVLYDITAIYHGSKAIHHIRISDILPDDIVYTVDLDNIIFINAPEIETEKIDNVLYWNFQNFTPVLEDGDSMSIRFELTIIDGELGEYENIATFYGSECYEYDHEEQDSAYFILREYIDVEKQVWNGVNWSESIEGAHKNDLIQFKITVTYHGPDSVKCMEIYDQLPDHCIEFAEDYEIGLTTTGVADFPSIYYSEEEKILYINWTTHENLFLENKESVSITFYVRVITHCEDTVINYACAYAWSCFDCTEMMDCDEAQVTCEPRYPIFEKQVWNGESWTDETEAIIGEKVRFRLSLTYYGNFIFEDIQVIDYLPCILDYAGNSNVNVTNVSEDNKIVWWNLTDYIVEDGETLIIEFNALVVKPSSGCGDEGTNLAIVYAYECGEYEYMSQDTANVTAIENYPPGRPIIDGDTQGKRRKDLNFQVFADNYQEQEVWYYIDWGDNSNSGWIGPYTQGVEIPLTHSWDKRGTYIVKAKAKDIHGAESGWSNEHSVKIVIRLSTDTTEAALQQVAGLSLI